MSSLRTRASVSTCKILTGGRRSTGCGCKLFRPLYQSALEGLLIIITDVRNGFRLVN